jgi:hypothetical protein
MRFSTTLKAGVALFIPLAIAACSDRASNDVTPAPAPGPPPPKASIQSMIGTSFAAIFDAGNTSDPKDPAATDVPPLSLTTEPIDN